MKAELKVAAVLTSAALLGGCASSGAGNPDVWRAMLCISGVIIYCINPSTKETTNETDGSSQALVATPAPVFTNWTELKAGGGTSAATGSGLAFALLYERNGDQTIRPGEIASSEPQWSLFRLNADGIPIPDVVGGYGAPTRADFHSLTETLAAVGQPGIAVGRSHVPYNAAGTPFLASAPEAHVGLFARPDVLGWSYHSFGIWNGIGDSTNGIVATSFGFATPISGVPTTGTAKFSGKLSGLYVSPTGQGSIAAADLTVSANFSTRSLTFASTGTVTTRDLATGTAAPNLNLSGTLTYSPNSHTFSGTLANAGGTMSGSSRGQFYGPAAEELGGVFIVKSPATVETFTGGFGAKR